MNSGELETPGLGIIQVNWYFEGNVLCVQGSGKSLRIIETDVQLVKYPARNRANILFGPYSPLPGYRVAMIEEQGVPIELVETKLTDEELSLLEQKEFDKSNSYEIGQK